ncbi:MAG: tRNA epoxyqueuosine(34) reductase QueG [Candidatus Eisenbacteria bacterium]|uniref:tRNA epoxyqueuosine(34) reductase QueG n=1 Tax=Eiseniibacteriota bacterium TaxID=2212470 RepID=A0A933SBV8_UNCEI|nr:tRNA epoxyqueuosine(34) reductase QueG [Candidatus Eisenbacteria bacterium]
MTPKEQLVARALDAGFEAARIAAVGPLEAQRHYEAWLAAGRHGEMAWLASEKHRARRADPSLLVRGIRSVLSVALCHPPLADAARDERLGRIARYAAGEDYHRVMKDKLLALETWIRTELFPGSGSLWYADTGAILERGWAERAGIGWVGKHSGVISPAFGSWFLLGQILLDRELEPDAPVAKDHCGTCTRCLGACPTGAIVAPYQVDARRCISYLTIEHKGVVPRELRAAIGDWLFGCDLCLDACPWNRFAPEARESRLHARELEGWTLERFLGLSEAAFFELFAESPIRRADREGFVRNVCIVLGNRRDDRAVGALARTLGHDVSPVVRLHAAWALGRIGGGAARAALAHAAPRERDPQVHDEIRLALEEAAA